MSGMLAAMAPQSMASLPTFFPAISSPTQIPIAMCVAESNSSGDYRVNVTRTLGELLFAAVFIQNLHVNFVSNFIVLHDD